MSGKGYKREKDPEIEVKINERVKLKSPVGVKIKFRDQYHKVSRENAQRTYWRKKLLEEKKKQSSGAEKE
jgi:hypothetical protein